MKRLCSKSGESITETLIAILMISLTFLFLASAVVTAAKANEAIKHNEINLVIESAPEDAGEITVNIEYTAGSTDHTVTLTANMFRYDEEGYCYYEYDYVPAP
ncbi:MAG: hypothetical protein IJV00_08495 [Clostridia bacterium]|nr:hypothetical protein [Clostridia bacterium]